MSEFETSFINKEIENKPFADTPAQKFFGEWCRINDSITPVFISREEWELNNRQVILKKNDQGKQTLFLPTDLHLWEMMDVIKTLDHDTYERNPEMSEERANKIIELGKTFEKAGKYISEYLPVINDPKAKTIAIEISREFYQYGLSLQSRKKRQDEIKDSNKLSQYDKTKMDEWFLGSDIYKKRIARLGENPTVEQIEETRKNLFSVYFKALGKQVYRDDSEKPWETKVGPIQYLQDRTRSQITKSLETPEREMYTSIFRRGVENLVKEMKEVGWRKAINDLLKKVGFDPIFEQRRLYDTLQIEILKKELEEVRQTSDITKISAKELEIAKKIQKAVSRFPYKLSANNPSEMLENQFINCVGASILGGGLLDEVGIKYLHADLPQHSATVLITSDGKLRWQDLTPGVALFNYKEIKDKDITGKNKNGKPLTVKDIVAFANNPTNEGISFEINKWWYNLNMDKIIIRNRYMGLFKPEVGLQSHILLNLLSYYNKNHRHEDSIAVINFIEQLGGSTHILSIKYLIGEALRNLGRNEDAIEAYQEAVNIDPNYADTYFGLGLALRVIGRNDESIQAFQQAVNIDPNYADTYFGLGFVLSDIGRNKEAIEAYQKFIQLWNGDKKWIEKAKKIIKELQQELKK